jgi:uncharacterized protein (TIGR02145 family)
MRASKQLHPVLLFIFFLIIAGSCEKNEPPTCHIIEPADGSVFSIGEVISLVVETEDPDGIVTEVRFFLNGEGAGEISFPFEYEMQTGDLQPGPYQIRVTAWDNEGLEASDEVGIILQAAKPVITTSEAGGITFHSAVLGGRAADDGGSEITESGVYWDTIPDSQEDGTRIVMSADTGSFADTVRNLPMGKMIYFRAFALNQAGESLGGERQFTTPSDPVEPSVPTVTTVEQVDSLTSVSAVLRGELVSDGGAAILEQGFYWGTETSPELTGYRVKASGDFRRLITGLSPNTVYYFRAFAENSAGEALGAEVSFTTPGELEVTTGGVIDLFFKKAVVTANVIIVGSSIVTERGVYWGESPSPELTGTKIPAGNGEGNYSVTLEGLTPGKPYYYKAYGESGSGVYLGQARSVATVPADTGSFIDARDNQRYTTVHIGAQVWMGENLRAIRLNDGTDIAETMDSATWFNSTDPLYCWYQDDEITYGGFGALYNWYAVESGKLCPSGWHVPSDGEWKILEIYLGIDSTLVNGFGNREGKIGGLLKSTEQWLAPNTGATNETMMNILPTGGKNNFLYDEWGERAYFWTSDSYEDELALIREFRYNSDYVNRTYNSKISGLSVRCVQDE